MLEFEKIKEIDEMLEEEYDVEMLLRTIREAVKRCETVDEVLEMLDRVIERKL